MATTTETPPAPQNQNLQTQQNDPRLPSPFSTTPTPLHLLTQGAEALVYKTTFLTPTTPCALKIRPPKPWRHPLLDRRLTRARVLAETRVLLKCAREGVNVPALLGCSWEEGWVALEWVGGERVKELVRGRGVVDEEGVRSLMGRIGEAVGRLHAVGVVHGDLTTSNMILRPKLASAEKEGQTAEQGEGGFEGEIVLIDFGLAQQTVQEEDRAVDLYVLERSFGSTHPREEGFFGEVLEGYGRAFGKGAKGVLRKLEEVRGRGRKKSMIG